VGHVTINTENCKGCGLCVAFCPKGVLCEGDDLNALGYHPVEFIEGEDGCNGCARCALICPDAAVTVYR
jgi:2-oxoglutarate ferredoxin oxidoreductase subunit delta